MMNGREEGYTVLEAIVAFAILALVLISLYSATFTSMRMVGQVHRADIAIMLARSKLAQLALMPGPLARQDSGTFPDTDITWTLSTTDDSQSKNTAHAYLQNVTLVLEWPLGTSRKTLHVLTRHLVVKHG